MSDLDVLEAVAKAATRGQWEIEHHYYMDQVTLVEETGVFVKPGNEDMFYVATGDDDGEAISNAIYIATANPDAMLHLIERVRLREFEIDNLDDLIAELRAERDAYKARLDAVRATVEYEKHWNDGYGWDVATIRILAALDGDPTG